MHSYVQQCMMWIIMCSYCSIYIADSIISPSDPGPSDSSEASDSDSAAGLDSRRKSSISFSLYPVYKTVSMNKTVFFSR